MELPAAVCEKIDKINRSFFWGDTVNKKRMHLINWNQVCESKDNGGLGLKKARTQNKALLTKRGWKMMTEHGSLWTSVLRDKYLTNHSLLTWPTNRACSHTWKSIIHTLPILKKGTKWTIGDGQNVSLWKDWWCGDEPLGNKYLGPHVDSGLMVKDIIDNNAWDLNCITPLVSSQTLADILNIHIPMYSNTPDSLLWIGFPNDFL